MKSCLFVAVFALLFALPAEGQDSGVKLSFVETIKPVLLERCLHCHNRETLPDKVSFESREMAFVLTKAGQPIIVPGKPEESLMVIALETPRIHEKAMPLVGPRPSVDEIKLIRRWIAEGADWPAGAAGKIEPIFRAKE